MNRLFSTAVAALLILCSFAANAGTHAGTKTTKDTILLKLKKADKLMIITNKNQVGVRGLTEYDLNQIVRQVDSVLRNTNTVAYTRDGKGQFSVTWPTAGMYWLDASTKDNKTTVPQAKERRLSYAATLEVMP